MPRSRPKPKIVKAPPPKGAERTKLQRMFDSGDKFMAYLRSKGFPGA